MLDERFGIEAQIVRIGADHLERVHALGHAGHVAAFDGVDVIGVNAGGGTCLVKRLAALLALAGQIPASLADRVGGAIGLQPHLLRFQFCQLGFAGYVNTRFTHDTTLGTDTVHRLLSETFPYNDEEW